MIDAYFDDDSNYAAQSSVAAWESAGEAVGQMATGSRSALLYCPRCHESNCLMACHCNGLVVASHYDCLRCGKTIEADEL